MTVILPLAYMAYLIYRGFSVREAPASKGHDMT